MRTVWTLLLLGIEVSWDELAECLSLSMVNFHNVMLVRECLNEFEVSITGLQNSETKAEDIINEKSVQTLHSNTNSISMAVVFIMKS